MTRFEVMDHLYTEVMTMIVDQEDSDTIYRHEVSTLRAARLDYLLDWLPYIKARRMQNNKKVYSYLLTFTLDPNKGASIQQLEDWVQTLPVRPALKVIYFEYVKEHILSNAHIHVYVQTHRFLRKDYFKTAERKFGKYDFKQVTKGTEDKTRDYLYKTEEDKSPVYFYSFTAKNFVPRINKL